MKQRVLVIEDDPHIRLGICAALEDVGYEVIECGNGAEALPCIRQHQPQLVVLDIMLPGKNGFDICRELRALDKKILILMLTAKGQEIDKVVGLELGADDYVTKPFSVREFLARVQSLLRRLAASQESVSKSLIPEKIEFGAVSIDCAALRGTRQEKGKKITFDLTARELNLLALLFHEAGKVVDRNRILNEIWGQEYYGTTRTLDQVIVKLRQKIEPNPAEPQHLLTAHGVGYRLEI